MARKAVCLLGLLVTCLPFVQAAACASGDSAATINGEPVSAAEVQAEFRLAYGERKLADEQRERLLRAALDQVIDRRLVMAYLTKAGEAASKADVDLELTQFEKALKAQNVTLAQHCERVGLSLDNVRRALAWKLSWKRYCEKQITPDNLEKYFGRNRRDFDGTQLRVSQILWKLPADADDTAVQSATEKATQVRQEIVAGKTSFADAAKRHSQAPSRSAGGDIGWIERHRPMPADFSRAAFALKVGEMSEPLVSSFGVHLITVAEEKPGTKSWQDVESELRPAVALYLFRWIADKERPAAKIEYAADP
jgi:peptidyl-prolyl cis-trans isomerase SurA